MPEGTAEVMYALFFLSLGIFAIGFYQSFRSWQRGGHEVAWDHPGRRLKNLFRIGVVQVRVARKKYAGPMHGMIFWGFIVLFIGTVIVLIDYDITLTLFHFQFLLGNFYLGFELVLDAFGIVFLAGLAMAIRRRLKPQPILPVKPLQDMYLLGTFLFLGVTGYLIEALRLAIRDPDWGTYSFVGTLLKPLFDGLTLDAQQAAYRSLWWGHALVVFAWIATIPYTKMRHIFTSPANILFSTPYGPGVPKGELPTPFDLQKALETGNLDLKSGAQKLEDFTWRQLLSLDACTECGRCTEVCPAYAAGRPLSPMKVVLDLRDEMHGKESTGWKIGDPGNVAEIDGNQLIEQVIEAQTLWSCVTCRACMNACPVMIEHVPLIVEMRRGLVMESRIDSHKTRLLTNLTNTGNAYGFPASDRAKWAEGLDVPVLGEGEPREIEVLYWVGCAGSYDGRNQKVSRALVKILRSANVSFAILGNQERCNGDPARRLGEEGRYQELVMANVENFRKFNVKKVVSQCPHCFNTLKNEYRRFGVDLDVVHHTQFIQQLIAEGRLKPSPASDEATTYHDPCYLGRYNDEYDAPRSVLRLVGGKFVREMGRNCQNSFCCGAGGSNMWYEVKEERERMSNIRFREAEKTGAKRLALACPFCMTMFDDAQRVLGDESMRVQDVAEIVADGLTPK